MIKKLLLGLLILNASLYAQTDEQKESRPQCGTMQHLESMLAENPQLEAEMNLYNSQLQEWIAANPEAGQGARATITIPVVFHILYNTAAENISDAEVESQVVAMNKDFMGTNTDASKTPTAFKNLIGTPQIQFCLAKRTPDGKPTNGIIHKSTTKTSFTDDNAAKYTSRGGDDAWDTKKYFNIWICDLGSRLLGYAEFPTGTATKTFGYVGHYLYTGTINSRSPFDLGRTTTHEIGHCLGLKHIFNDYGNCSDNDGISDTPVQQNSSSGCPTFPQSNCTGTTNGEMFMNYMDYSDDKCMFMFTKGQTTKMLSIINNPPYNALKTSDACTPPTTTGISSIALNNNLQIYPNPNNGIMNISFDINEQVMHTVEIKNVLGQVVYKEEINAPNGNYSKSIDIQKFGKGTYTVLLLNDRQVLANKVIVY